MGYIVDPSEKSSNGEVPSQLTATPAAPEASPPATPTVPGADGYAIIEATCQQVSTLILQGGIALPDGLDLQARLRMVGGHVLALQAHVLRAEGAVLYFSRLLDEATARLQTIQTEQAATLSSRANGQVH